MQNWLLMCQRCCGYAGDQRDARTEIQSCGKAINEGSFRLGSKSLKMPNGVEAHIPQPASFGSLIVAANTLFDKKKSEDEQEGSPSVAQNPIFNIPLYT